ncbi:uncharacterized protein G2W53_013843 [Senna tora]|uniref:Uncharacterized protein n=1 Tax=Senna tora TaxID=362788 RepID=A0A834TZM5_9FABA|nr:uncharacterized protein G2W53_013843 [Senna tora]
MTLQHVNFVRASRPCHHYAPRVARVERPFGGILISFRTRSLCMLGCDGILIQWSLHGSPSEGGHYFLGVLSHLVDVFAFTKVQMTRGPLRRVSHILRLVVEMKRMRPGDSNDMTIVYCGIRGSNDTIRE